METNVNKSPKPLLVNHDVSDLVDLLSDFTFNCDIIPRRKISFSH